jgi:hypothetical protein
LGYGNYRSSSALTKNLVSKRERLDVIDEIASLFAQMKSGGLYQTEILDELCKLWSDSNTKYMASEYAEREDTSTCYNPCVNILGSSTIEGIKANIGKMTTIKGLMPRFLIFAHEDYGQVKQDFLNEELLKQVVADIGGILEIEKPISKKEVDLKQGPMYQPFDVAPRDKDAVEYFKDLKSWFASAIEKESNESARYMLTRGKEQVMKLSTLHAVSNGRGGGANIDDISWAKAVFDVSLHNSRMFIEETNVETGYERDLTQVLNFITKKGKATEAVICSYVKRIPKRTIKEILSHLVSMNEVKIAKIQHKGNKKLVEHYVPVN